MAILQVLLIDDDPRMEMLLRGPVGLPADRLARDPAGIFEPDPGRHGLVLLNAEVQKSFGLCRRFKKKKESASVPIAFFTFSHDREHLRILAEHRSLPTHADHYLLPPVSPERMVELLTRTLGEFETQASEAPPPPPPPPDADLDAAELEDDADFAEAELHESTREDLTTARDEVATAPNAAVEPPAPPTAEPIEADEFADVPAESDDAIAGAAVLSGTLGAFPHEPSISQPEPSLGGFQADRITSVERYVSRLHGEFVRMEDQIEERRAELDVERERLQAERDAALAEAQRATALVEENRLLKAELKAALELKSDPSELERAQSELAALRAEAEWARTEAESKQVELTRARTEADRLLGEADRLRGESERLRAELAAVSERAHQADNVLTDVRERAQADTNRLGAQVAALEARISRATHRLASLGETLRVARPSLAALLELSRDLDLEGVPDVDGAPPGFDDR